MRRAPALVALALLLGGCARAQSAQTEPPAAANDGLEARAASDSGLLAERRLARLPAPERQAWRRYVEASRRLRAADVDSMRRELRAAGRDRMTRAPDVRQSFAYRDEMRGAWFRTDSARLLLDAVLSYQAPNGGWSKHVDFWKGRRQPGQSYFSETDRWQYISTIDNNSTTAELWLLAAAYDEVKDERHAAAFRRGIDYLLAAQMPTGCWPQVFPLQGGYYDAATFNDDAIVNVLELFREAIGLGRRGSPLVPAAPLARLEAAQARGLSCILRSQVVLKGVRTVWGQQHDPLTLLPTGARSYELPGLSGRESAGIMRHLMDVPSPGDSVIAAVHAAADWFEAHKIHGYDYDYMKGRTENPNAEPLWARLTDLETDRPIFANRDGVKLYDWNQLTDRRSGYAWYGREPAAALREYARWARKYPRR